MLEATLRGLASEQVRAGRDYAVYRKPGWTLAHSTARFLSYN